MKKFLMVVAMISVLSGCGYKVSYDSDTGFEGGSMDDLPKEEVGYIEGGLSYPSDRIPDNLMICTDGVSGSSCGTFYERLQGDEYTYGIGYRIEVPAGTYKVYSKTDVAGNDVFGGYTEHVECGMAPECEDHTLIPVTVEVGETVTGVDIEDFQVVF